MRARDYQIMAETFDNHGPLAVMKETAAVLGLTAEAGEVANEYERSFRAGRTMVDLEKVKTELGDVLWNVARIASLNGWDLEEIMDENIDKLTQRFAGAGVPVART